MSYEKPEDKWKREKQYQPQTPGPEYFLRPTEFWQPEGRAESPERNQSYRQHASDRDSWRFG